MSLLLSTLEPTQCHFCFEQKNDEIIPVSSEYSSRQSRMLGIHSVYSRIEIDSIKRICGVIPFWNNINQTHSKLDYEFQLQTTSNTTTLLVALLYVIMEWSC